jgi:hypothetical protein
MNPLNSMNRSSNSNTLTDKVKNVFSKTKNIGDKMMNSTSKIKNTVSSGFTDKVNKLTTSASSSQTFQGVSSFFKTFTESNTAFSKFVFIILVLLAFIFLFQIGMAIMTSFITGYSGEVYVVKGMCNSNKEKKITANPNIKDSVSIIKSINRDDGIEFTWNVWFYIDDVDNNNYDYKRIFSKGKGLTDTSVLESSLKTTNSPYSKIMNNSPGMYITRYIPDNTSSIAPNINFTTDSSNVSLVICLNTYNSSNSDNEFAELITIKDVFLKKWMNCALIIKNRTANVYINGKYNKQKILNNIPIQNNYDTYVGDDTGFNGYISNLKYYNRAISYEEVRSLYSKGPNLTSVDTTTPNGQDYTSMSWYYNIDK